MKQRRSMACTVLLALLCATGTLAMSAQSDVVATDKGKVQGSVQGGVLSFKGVPFAAPPVGALRWRAPQPIAAWQGIRPAKDFGPDCMQLPFPSDAAPLGVSPSEDCLYVNVWRPATAAKKLPVMVWIYGGGFVNGGSSPSIYDGKHFAADGIVFVSFNYRIGRFGFFAHPALSKEHPEEAHGNYGYMDQIAALKWVQRNIAAFGGDAGNVTIFGESAGGGSVLTMLTSPQAKGLFERAIVESGGGRSTLMGQRYLDKDSPSGMPSLEKIGVNFAAHEGITDTGKAGLDALRALPAEKIVDGMNMASMGQAAQTYGGPILDGEIVRESPQTAIEAGRWAKVPVMIGANSLDIGFPSGRTIDELFAPFGAKAEEAKAIYNPDHSDNVMLVGMRIAADQMMVEPSRFVARAVSAEKIPAYEYRFSYVAQSLRDKLPGAPHATEIPYVFLTVDAAYKDKLAAQDEDLSKKAHAYWVNFVKSGNPSGVGVPTWQPYTEQNDFILDFTNNGPVGGADPWKTRLDMAAEIIEARAAAAPKAQ